jgi:tight adherence protein B
MVIAIGTFLLCLAIIGGAYWAFVLRPEERASRRLRRRLSPERSERRDGDVGLTKKEQLTAVKMLDAVLARAGHLDRPIQQSISLAALSLTPGIVLLASGFAASVALVVSSVLFSSTLLALVAAVTVGFVPFWYVRWRASRRLAKLEEQFPMAIDQIAVSLRAGHALTTGLLMVAEEIPDPLGAEFRLVHDQQKFGKPLPDVLKELTKRVPLLDVRIFVTAVLTQRETGGNLAEVLDKLSALIRERFNVRRQVRAVSAHGRITGWVLVALPVAVAAVLSFVAPAHLQTLTTDPLGLQLLAGGIVLQVIGTLAIRRIVNIEL